MTAEARKDDQISECAMNEDTTPASVERRRDMAEADADEAENLGRLRRFSQLQRDVVAARQADEAWQRLERQLRIEAVRHRAISTTDRWRAA